MSFQAHLHERDATAGGGPAGHVPRADDGRRGRRQPQRRPARDRPRHRRLADAAPVDRRRVRARVRRPAAPRRCDRRPLRAQADPRRRARALRARVARRARSCTARPSSSGCGPSWASAAAFVMPVTLSVITTIFPPEERGKAVGTWVGVAAGGGVLGLFASGLLLEWLAWPSIFGLNVVLAALALVGTLAIVPATRESRPPRSTRSARCSRSVALAALVFGIIEGPERGWSDPRRSPRSPPAAAGIVLFVLWELRRPRADARPAELPPPRASVPARSRSPSSSSPPSASSSSPSRISSSSRATRPCRPPWRCCRWRSSSCRSRGFAHARRPRRRPRRRAHRARPDGGRLPRPRHARHRRLVLALPRRSPAVRRRDGARGRAGDDGDRRLAAPREAGRRVGRQRRLARARRRARHRRSRQRLERRATAPP